MQTKRVEFISTVHYEGDVFLGSAVADKHA